MTFPVVIIACLLSAWLLCQYLRHAWRLDDIWQVPYEAAARLLPHPTGPAALRRRLLRVVCDQRIVMASGEKYAVRDMVVRISPEDAYRLHPAADLRAIEDDTVQAYMRHARREHFVVTSLPLIQVEVDGALRPGWIPPARPIPRSASPIRDLDTAATIFSTTALDDPLSTTLQTVDATVMARSTPELRISYAGHTYEINDNVIGLGRKHNGIFEIVEPTTSFKHALLECRDGSWTVTDLDSRNGTTVDGTPLGSSKSKILVGAHRLDLGAAEVQISIVGNGE